MPVFNDFNHYYVGGGHSNYSTPSYGGLSSAPASSSYGLSSPYSSRPNYFQTSNYHSPNIVSSLAASGLTSRYKNNNYGYKGRGQYNENRANPFTPSPYTTYSLWKENQIAAKYRSDHYYRRNQAIREPVYIEPPKIDRGRKIDNSSPQYTILPVEKPIARDEQGTIKRGRTVVRMHTKMLKENPHLMKKEVDEGKQETEPETFMESRLNRLSPIRISRLKKRSILNYKRNDSGSKNWLDSDSSDSEGSVERKSTVRKKKTVKRNDEARKTDRRLSTEMYEEQLAILDSMIKEELARKDADDYFSDPKRGTVKIRRSHSTDSNTDDEDMKRKFCGKSETTPSSSRRNSLFQDLIIGETISETFIEDLENKIQNSYTNADKVFPKMKVGSVKITQKLLKKSRFDEGTIVEVDENRPKTPKFFIDDIKIESSQFDFNEKEIKAYDEVNKLGIVEDSSQKIENEFDKKDEVCEKPEIFKSDVNEQIPVKVEDKVVKVIEEAVKDESTLCEQANNIPTKDSSILTINKNKDLLTKPSGTDDKDLTKPEKNKPSSTKDLSIKAKEDKLKSNQPETLKTKVESISTNDKLESKIETEPSVIKAEAKTEPAEVNDDRAKTPTNSTEIKKDTKPEAEQIPDKPNANENAQKNLIHPKPKKPTKKTVKKSTQRKPMGQIVHMKPRAMTIRTVQNRLPSLKTPRLAALPQPTQAVLIAAEDAESSSSEEDESEEEESSTEVEESSDESTDSSDSKQGKQRKSTSSLDSGFGSACYKTRKGIPLELGIIQSAWRVQLLWF